MDLGIAGCQAKANIYFAVQEIKKNLKQSNEKCK